MSLNGGMKKGPELIREKKVTLVVLAIALILSAGILAYNMDSIYAVNNSNIKAVMPSDYSGGEEVKFPALVTDLKGEPKKNEQVSVYLKRDGGGKDLLYKGQTSEQGINNVKFKLPEGEYEGTLIMRSSGETIKKDISVRGEKKLFVSTDKPIYQPGQTVHIRSLCFEGDEPLDKSDEVTYTIKTPSGDKIFRESLSPNEFGISSYNYTLSDLLPLGTYELKVSVGDKTVKEQFIVDKYVLPRFKIDFRGLEDWYLQGDSISGTLDVQYFFGKKVDGEAQVRLQYGGEVIDTYSDTLEDGQMPFYFEDIYSQDGHLTLNATVTDTSGHEEWDSKDIPVADTPVQFKFISSKNVPKTESLFTVRLTHPDGSPAAGLKVNGELGNKDLSTRTTGSNGVAEWKVTYAGEKEVTFSTQYQGEKYQEDFIISENKGIKLLPVEGGDEVGQTKRFQLYYKGDSLTNRIYYSVQTQTQVLYSDYFVMKGKSRELSIPVVYEMAPEYRVNVYAVEKNLSFSSDTYTGKVSTERYLNLDISTGRESYLPGEGCSIDFHVSERGKPTRAAVGVKITDESLYELNQLSGMDKVLTKEGEESQKEGRGFEVMTAGGSYQEAKQIQDRWVSSYWSSLLLLGFIGAVVLFILSLKYKPAGAVLVAGLLIFGFGGVSMYQTLSTQSSADISADDGAVPEGQQEAGGDMGRQLMPTGDGQEKSAAPSDETGGEGEEKSSETRTHFPETWYWNPTLITDKKGEARLNLTTPDSITNWLVEGVASTKKGEMTGNTTDIKVFKEFFVEPDIPVSAVRGDRFSLRVMVYNYLNESVEAQVVLEDSDWFTLHDEEMKTVNLDAGAVGAVHYDITAKTVGKHEISISGITDEKEDSIRKIMRVKPNGEKEVETFNGQLTNDDKANISFTPDEDHVPGSQKAYVKLYGSMDAITLDSAEGFIHQVSGCGEQSMSTLSINVLAFNIASNSEHPPENMEEYESIVTQGIQHELTFLKEAENGKGRGIVWFPSDEDVHPWLTSWGLLTFQDAKKAGFMIDDAIMKDMQTWLVSQQDENGSWEFPERGLYETTSQTLKTKNVATTAYIARSLVYSGYDPSSGAVTEAVDYIQNNVDRHWDDPYTLSVSALAMELAGDDSSKLDSIVERIDELKKVENGTCHWETNQTMLQSGSPRFYMGGGNSRIIETTGYAIMALSGQGYPQTTDMAVQYLLENRNELGTFFSTQDTVVALQSLQYTSGEVKISNMNITISMNGGPVEKVNFDQENKDLTYFVDLRGHLKTNGTNNVTVMSEGEGKAAYTLVYEEYVDWSMEPLQHITLNAEVPEKAEIDEEYYIGIEVRYGEKAGYSKMGLVEIPIPTGFTTMKYDHLLEKEHVSNWEIKDGSLLIYLTDMSAGDHVELDIRFLPTRSGEIQVQGIRYYDMYSPDIGVQVDPTNVTVEG